MGSQKQAMLEREEMRRAYRRVFNSKDGRKVLDDLRLRLGQDKSVFDPNPYVAACNEGARSVYCYIADQLDFKKDR